MTSMAPGKRGQLGGEPALGGEVEMVGGLVEHECVGPPEEDPDDVDAPALSARERVDVVEQRVLAEPDPFGQTGDVALEVVAARGAVALLEVGEGGDGLGGRDRRPPPGGPCAAPRRGRRGPGPTARGRSRWARARGLPGVGTWGEEADGPLDVHVAGHPQVGRELPADDRHQRRLPRPVAADQAHLVVGPDHERGVAKQRPATDLDGEVAARDHPSIASGRVTQALDTRRARREPIARCGREESNLHPRRDGDLNPARLPFRHARSAPPPASRRLSGHAEPIGPSSHPARPGADIPGSLVPWHHTPHTHHPWSQACPVDADGQSARSGLGRRLPAPPQGAHHLPGQRHRRGRGEPGLRPAPAPGGREQRARHRPLRQLPGGSVTDGLAIYDTMQYVSCDVSTICVGLAASMGQFLSVRRGAGQALRPPPQPDPHAPALGADAGPGHRHRHPGRADRLPQADDGRAHLVPHRPAHRAHRGGLGP